MPRSVSSHMTWKRGIWALQIFYLKNGIACQSSKITQCWMLGKILNCYMNEWRKFIHIHSWHATQFSIIKCYFLSVTMSNYPNFHIERYFTNFEYSFFSYGWTVCRMNIRYISLNNYIWHWKIYWNYALKMHSCFLIFIFLTFAVYNVTFYERPLIRCSWYNYVMSGSNKDSLQTRCKLGNRSCDQVRFAFRYFDY